MKERLILLTILVFLGCKERTIAEEDLRFLNGYWEISEVRFPNGDQKKYSVNPSVDFIQMNNSKGFRKKVSPKFDGSYQVFDDAESFTIVPTDQSFLLHYKNTLSEREERLVHLDTLSFSVITEEGLVYAYKRFQPIVIPQ